MAQRAVGVEVFELGCDARGEQLRAPCTVDDLPRAATADQSVARAPPRRAPALPPSARAAAARHRKRRLVCGRAASLWGGAVGRVPHVPAPRGSPCAGPRGGRVRSVHRHRVAFWICPVDGAQHGLFFCVLLAAGADADIASRFKMWISTSPEGLAMVGLPGWWVGSVGGAVVRLAGSAVVVCCDSS